MKLWYAKSKWGAETTPLREFLSRVKDSGFDATDLNPSVIEETPEESIALHKEFGLKCVCFVGLNGATVAAQLADLDKWFPIAMAYQPLHLNFHAGRDIFSFEDNLVIFRRIYELGQKHHIDITHETHRARPLFSTFEAVKYLQSMPELWLNADFSHWMVVHESTLRDQPEAMELAIQHSRYIHARVGHEEGPQITDPRAPEWKDHLDNHIDLWQRIVAANRKAKRSHLVITPEFGPPPYMPALPYTRQPVADLWEICTAMMQILRERLK